MWPGPGQTAASAGTPEPTGVRSGEAHSSRPAGTLAGPARMRRSRYQNESKSAGLQRQRRRPPGPGRRPRSAARRRRTCPWCRSSRRQLPGRAHARAGPARPGRGRGTRRSPRRRGSARSPTTASGPARRAGAAAASSAVDAGVVDDRRHAAGVRRPRRRRRTARRCSSTSSRDQVRAPRPRRRRRGSAAVPSTSPARGDGVRGAGRPSTWPQTTLSAGPRVDPAGQRGRQLGDDLAQRVDQVGGQVRAGGVAAGAGAGATWTLVGGRR